MRAVFILAATGLVLATPASAQFSYPAHGPRTLDREDRDRAFPMADTHHLLDPASGPPAPGFHLLDPPRATPIEPTYGYGARYQQPSTDAPPPRRVNYNMRPANRAPRPPAAPADSEVVLGRADQAAR